MIPLTPITAAKLKKGDKIVRLNDNCFFCGGYEYTFSELLYNPICLRVEEFGRLLWEIEGFAAVNRKAKIG